MPSVDLRLLPPPPTTLPPWGKVLYYLFETALVGASYLAYDYAAEIQPAGGTVEDPTAGTWRHFVYTFENMTSGETADDQQITWDVVNVTGGLVDSTWNTTDYQTVTTGLNPLVQAIAAAVSSSYACTGVKAYVKGYRPYSDPKPFIESGPPDHVETFSLPGGASSTSAPQVSSTLTEMTAARAHWGRTYLPTIGTSAIATTGRMLATEIDRIMDVASTQYLYLWNNQFPVVVPTVQSDKVPVRVLQTVSAIRMDDVLDTMRSRRYKSALIRETRPTV